MISKIAHELRSPLTSVKGFSATLVKRWDKFTDEQRFQFVETIHAEADRMGRIVGEVLDLARLEANRLELRSTLVDVAEVARKSADHHQALPGAERISIEVPEGVKAWADPERLDHVVSNLIENAVKFSDEGPITVTAAPAENGMVEIVVTDRGVGIEADRIPHIWSGPAPSGQRAGPSGTGLGLYLSKRLIEAHGGSVDVHSEVDGGSTFTIRIPARGPESD